MGKIFDVCIIGGGQGGIIAAINLKRKGLNVCIIEAKDRIGKKILSTGNGKCNILNADLSLDNYNNNFPKIAFQKYDLNKLKEFYSSLGIFLKQDSEGRIYPYSESANTILNAYLDEINKLNIDVFVDTKIERIEKIDEGFLLRTKLSEYKCKKVLLATGSNATTGLSSHALFAPFGHNITKLEQSLVPIKTNALKGANGVRAKAKASLYISNKLVFSENGELLFKDNQLSGILAFKMSAYIAREYVKKGNVDAYIEIDFVPDYTEAQLKELLSNSKLTNPLQGLLHKAIAQNFNGSNLAYDIKHLRCKVDGLMGIDNAQVISGGLDISQFDESTMESKLQKGLYAIGEVLDVDGQCGGYNLSFAASSALLASDAIYSELCK